VPGKLIQIATWGCRYRANDWAESASKSSWGLPSRGSENVALAGQSRLSDFTDEASAWAIVVPGGINRGSRNAYAR